MESQSYVYMLLWLHEQSSLQQGLLSRNPVCELASFLPCRFLHVKSKDRTFPRYCLVRSCGLAFDGRSAPASHCPIQPSFPMVWSWPWITVSLLLLLCPCGQVGWRNRIQLKNNLWKKINKSVYFPACFTACLEKKCCAGTGLWDEERGTKHRARASQQGHLLLALLWPLKSCSACRAHSTLPVTCLIVIILSLIEVLSPSLYFSASNSSACKGLSSTYH